MANWMVEEKVILRSREEDLPTDPVSGQSQEPTEKVFRETVAESATGTCSATPLSGVEGGCAPRHELEHVGNLGGPGLTRSSFTSTTTSTTNTLVNSGSIPFFMETNCNKWKERGRCFTPLRPPFNMNHVAAPDKAVSPTYSHSGAMTTPIMDSNPYLYAIDDKSAWSPTPDDSLSRESPKRRGSVVPLSFHGIVSPSFPACSGFTSSCMGVSHSAEMTLDATATIPPLSSEPNNDKDRNTLLGGSPVEGETLITLSSHIWNQKDGVASSRVRNSRRSTLMGTSKPVGSPSLFSMVTPKEVLTFENRDGKEKPSGMDSLASASAPAAMGRSPDSSSFSRTMMDASPVVYSSSVSPFVMAALGRTSVNEETTSSAAAQTEIRSSVGEKENCVVSHNLDVLNGATEWSSKKSLMKPSREEEVGIQSTGDSDFLLETPTCTIRSTMVSPCLDQGTHPIMERHPSAPHQNEDSNMLECHTNTNSYTPQKQKTQTKTSEVTEHKARERNSKEKPEDDRIFNEKAEIPFAHIGVEGSGSSSTVPSFVLDELPADVVSSQVRPRNITCPEDPKDEMVWSTSRSPGHSPIRYTPEGIVSESPEKISCIRTAVASLPGNGLLSSPSSPTVSSYSSSTVVEAGANTTCPHGKLMMKCQSTKLPAFEVSSSSTHCGRILESLNNGASWMAHSATSNRPLPVSSQWSKPSTVERSTEEKEETSRDNNNKNVLVDVNPSSAEPLLPCGSPVLDGNFVGTGFPVERNIPQTGTNRNVETLVSQSRLPSPPSPPSSSSAPLEPSVLSFEQSKLPASIRPYDVSVNVDHQCGGAGEPLHLVPTTEMDMDVLFAASPSGCGGSAKTASTVTAMNDTNKMATSGSFLTATWRNGNGMLGCRGGFSHGIASMEMSADDFLPSPSQHLFPTISTNDYGIASINRSESPLTLDTSSSFVSEHSTERGTENVFRSTNSALESTMPFAPSGIANPHYGYAWTHEISTHSHSLGRGKANPPSGGKRVGMETSHASSSPFLSASFKPGGGEHSSRSHCATRETTTSLTDHRTLSHHSLYLGATRPFYSDPSSASTNVVTSSLVVEDTYSN